MLKYKIPQIVTLTHEILFKEYPDIKKGYYLSMRLGLIYHQRKFKDIALTRAHPINQGENSLIL